MSEPVPFGTRAFDAIVAAKRAKPTITRLEAAIIIQDLFDAECRNGNLQITGLEAQILSLKREIEVLKATARPAKKPKGSPPAANRPRNPLFDQLATSTGTNPLEATRPKNKEIAVALADIKAVCPDLTTQEIDRRARAYKQAHPDWTLSAPALAKHWGEFGKGPPSRTGARDIYQEPPDGMWREAGAKLPVFKSHKEGEPHGYFDGQTWSMETVRWLDLPTYLRTDILKAIYP